MWGKQIWSLPSLKLIQGHFMRGGYIIDTEIVGSKAKYRKSRGSLTLTKWLDLLQVFVVGFIVCVSLCLHGEVYGETENLLVITCLQVSYQSWQYLYHTLTTFDVHFLGPKILTVQSLCQYFYDKAVHIILLLLMFLYTFSLQWKTPTCWSRNDTVIYLQKIFLH